MTWIPLKPVPPEHFNPDLMAAHKATSTMTPSEVWTSPDYSVTVHHFEASGRAGFTHLSIHRQNRDVIRDWRHLQQIKNEICGAEREAIEVFPAESRLVDTANEFHLWVLPEGERVPWGMPERDVFSDDDMRDFNYAPHKGRLRPWEKGLTTGGDRG